MMQLQRLLFEIHPSRKDLLDYQPLVKRPSYRIGVYRNHSFEFIEHTIGAYLDYAGIGAEFFYSDYDDSLTFFNLDCNTDLLILWLDLARYRLNDLDAFLKERIDYLENLYPHPILLIPFEGLFSYKSEKIACFDLAEIKRELGARYLDERLEVFSGTRMSAKASMKVSAQLGLQYLPALLRPALKAIIVDLDYTLYQGVLGEDGAKGLVLTAGHRRLQEQLKNLAGQGVFLCVASKNDERDVYQMFHLRQDFPLRLSDFTKICVNWGSKNESIGEIARYLNINPDSMLFIDDNPGELANVAASFPEIKQIHALEDANVTACILSQFPGLLRLNIQREDQLRKCDVQANEARQRIKNTLSQEDYIRSLKMKLLFTFDYSEQAARVAELANKTNQFICSYRRYGLAEVNKLMRDQDYTVITASLSDRLSDSGIIGVCVARKQKDFVEIEECFVSCRALGRGIDEIIVLGMMRCALDHFDCELILVNFINGARNEPAHRFVEAKLKSALGQPAPLDYRIPLGLVNLDTIKYEKGEL